MSENESKINDVILDENISISFKTTAEITKRTVIVSEAFGLGIDEEKQFTIYDNIQVQIKKNDIVYITGDSGGGKSCLLRILKEKLSETLDVISLNDLKINSEEILIENVGDTIEKAMEILTQAGLGDAFLMLRKYSNLSDGQKYRYGIAKMINSSANVWLIDEFCAALDRDAAKVISYSLQKIARKLNRIVIVATTHNDLIHDLNPTLLISKNFGEGVSISRNNYEKNSFSLSDQITFRLSTFKEYENSGLAAFHYKSSHQIAGIIHVYVAELHNKIIGALITKYPPLELQERNFITEKKYTKNYSELNKDIETISRVVIHPKFRGIGLGSRIVKKYIDSEHARKIVETIAVMARYNPFFERAGMKRVVIERKQITKNYETLMLILEKLGFDLQLITSKRYNFDRLAKLENNQIELLKNYLLKEYKKIVMLYGTKDSKNRIKLEEKINEEKECLEANKDFLAEAIKKIKKPDLAYYIYFKNNDK